MSKLGYSKLLPGMPLMIQCDCGAVVARGRFKSHIWTNVHMKKKGVYETIWVDDYIERYIDPEPGTEWYEKRLKKVEECRLLCVVSDSNREPGINNNNKK